LPDPTIRIYYNGASRKYQRFVKASGQLIADSHNESLEPSSDVSLGGHQVEGTFMPLSGASSIAGRIAAESKPHGNNEYWQSLSGYTYEQIIRDREARGNKNYAQQEQFLTSFIASEQQRRGRVIGILEVGCGFGRHARYLSCLDSVRYHGYDSSASMTAPLSEDPPIELQPTNEHIFVGPDVQFALGSRKFDVIFTVSVLIHNSPDQVGPLVTKMTESLSDGGTICLIENDLVPFSVYENDWHQGCWLHNFLELIDQQWDIFIEPDKVETHTIYVLRPNSHNKRRVYKLKDIDRPDDQREPISDTELIVAGLKKLKSWAQGRQVSEKPADPSPDVHIWELEETLAAERAQFTERIERLERKLNLLSVSDYLATIRMNPIALPQQAQNSPKTADPSSISSVLFDDHLDITWANPDPHFPRVVHIFHQEWHGLRAAAGYLPGHKLAIKSDPPLTAAECQQAIGKCLDQNISTVVFHGFSSNSQELAQIMRRVLGRGLHIVTVLQSTTAQFRHRFEIEVIERLLRLKRVGVIDAIASTKPGMHLLSDQIFPMTLLNLPPSHSQRSQAGGIKGSVLIPVPNDWRKNFYTNLYAATSTPQLKTVYVSAEFARAEFERGRKIISLSNPSRHELFRYMRESDVVLNVTLSECQPMAALESLALGVPCLTGPLGLGDLDRHPYQQLVQICNVDSLASVRERIDNVLYLQENSAENLRQMMDDYDRKLRQEALRRYKEFLRL
jgi:SAM-dependent methyltransferase